ncbi:hypothetical protein CDO73_02040 [Saccharibacillus sp. O23]|nr:hypothetical protein CDO73_02040 [Saccharibacillus sp. O23]
MTFGDMPEGPDGPLPEEAKSRIAHALVVSGSRQLMLSDTFPGMPYQVDRRSFAFVPEAGLRLFRLIFERFWTFLIHFEALSRIKLSIESKKPIFTIKFDFFVTLSRYFSLLLFIRTLHLTI